ncbi:hypothetical protein [Pseudomonas asplenii]|uniref:Uncharacterized protein n=1 Tax=Pseudomonas asplenii TaxID=53407 RepID=A0A1H6L9C5_9PSED|nr:hypothetical protein [Pseudomonas fuscovaginae]SEH84829.1 hypothetical protein SAMN05216581_0112 [Pseudomonas fuscovaginae]
MNYDQDLLKLTHLLHDCVQSESGIKIQPGEGWKNDAQVLAVKFFRHVTSIQQISAGTSFDFGDHAFVHIDHSSIAVLARASIETLLAFKYIFTNDDIDLCIFRHKLWILSGLNDRGKITAKSDKSKAVLNREAESIKLLKEQITQSPFYFNANRETRKEIDNCSWKPKGGAYVISGHVDIHQKYFSDIYNHLSGHAHASYISALQTRDAQSQQDQQMLAGAARQILCMALAHFLLSYSKLFPNALKLLQSDIETYNTVKNWHFRISNFKELYESHT